METIKKTNSLKGFISLMNPKLLLIVGIVMMSFSHLNFNIDFLAWGAMIPFLIYLRKEKVSYKWLYFTLALITAWSLIVFKIITSPIPYYLVPMYSIPIVLFHLPAYIVYAKIKNDKWAILAFPALLVVMEWIQYTFTPLASWGAAAYTQTDTAVITQSLSFFGMSGLGFMIYWCNTTLAALISSKSNSFEISSSEIPP